MHLVKNYLQINFLKEYKFEKQSLKGLEKTLSKSQLDTENKIVDKHRKIASTSTMKEKRNPRIVKKTSMNTTSLVKSVIRKTAGKSTRKK